MNSDTQLCPLCQQDGFYTCDCLYPKGRPVIDTAVSKSTPIPEGHDEVSVGYVEDGSATVPIDNIVEHQKQLCEKYKNYSLIALMMKLEEVEAALKSSCIEYRSDHYGSCPSFPKHISESLLGAREAFENWATKPCMLYGITRSGDDEFYRDVDTQEAWCGWLAAWKLKQQYQLPVLTEEQREKAVEVMARALAGECADDENGNWRGWHQHAIQMRAALTALEGFMKGERG